MLKNITIKIIALIAILFVLNIIYSKWFYENDIQKHSAIINLVRSVPNNADIIYVGESSNTSFRGDDGDKRPISEFIGDYFPNLNTYDITKPASHAGIYKVLLKNVPKENKVKTLIVTLNLRSFNAQWIYSRLETPLQKSTVLLNDYPPLLNRFFLSFKSYDIKSDKERDHQFKSKWKNDKFHLPYDFQFKNVIEWDKWMAMKGIKDEDGKHNQAKTELACHYIKTYAFQIDTINNPRIKDFNEIISLSKERGWNLVFNLLAENTEKADKLVGNDLIYIMEENTELLVEYYENKGVLVVNNLNCVEDELYIDQNWTTEHYAEKGRKTIARNVAKSIKQFHSNAYNEPIYKEKEIQTVFFNNGENGAIWGQMQTLTEEMAYSAPKSSLTGNGSDFSITFEFPLKNIPDTLKNNILIDFAMYQNATNHDGKLIIEASGSDINYYRSDFDLKNKITDVKVWKQYRNLISIPNSIKQADLIKIYIYNTSNEKIFIDDFRIKFE